MQPSHEHLHCDIALGICLPATTQSSADQENFSNVHRVTQLVATRQDSRPSGLTPEHTQSIKKDALSSNLNFR